jgi:hypothetical protein
MQGADQIRPQGDTVLERVLLAIIEAHTTPETEGLQQQRLDAAIAALLGLVAPLEQELDNALRFIMRERQRDICDSDMAVLMSPCAATAKPVRSIPQLAEAAVREVMGCIAPKEMQSTARRLCDLYCARGSAYAVTYDPITDALETESVERFCAELAEWGVPTRF